MNFISRLPSWLSATSALVLALVFLAACMPPRPPRAEPPPVEAVEADPVSVEDTGGEVGGYVEPVIEAAPLGTSWGEDISSSVGKVYSTRMTSLPAQVMILQYSADAPRGAVSDKLLLLDRTVRIRVLREDGTPWPIYQADGAVHLQGEVGERYIVEVENTSPTQAIEVALSIDGLSESNGRPAKPWGKGFVLEPHESWRFKGFRKSDDEVAAFRFSDVADSVAINRGSGSAKDAGVITFRVYKITIDD